jgi:membrane-associated phospholipid phosphatase
MTDRYALPGSRRFPQVEPDAAFWLRTPVPRALSLEEIRRELDHALDEFDETGTPDAQTDLTRVRRLAERNEDRAFFETEEKLSAFLREGDYILRPLPAGSTQASPSPIYPPPGSVYNRRDPIDDPFLKNGAELARLFEAETPGLWHRHILNILLDPTITGGPGQTLSPPRQALIWAALDVAISSALQAAWYYKWFSLDDRRFSFRERPWEADDQIPILYDYMIAYDAAGDIVRGQLRNNPSPTPGTPRHPAYPSGHSTYSAAASHVLGCFFPRYRGSFRLLANNIGRARIWAGVHWFQDHLAGQRIGSTVGRLVMDQLNRSGIAVQPSPLIEVPDQAQLRRIEDEFYRRSRSPDNFCPRPPVLVEVDPDRPRRAEPEWVMNPGGYFDVSAAQSVTPKADEDGEFDIEQKDRRGEEKSAD